MLQNVDWDVARENFNSYLWENYNSIIQTVQNYNWYEEAHNNTWPENHPQTFKLSHRAWLQTFAPVFEETQSSCDGFQCSDTVQCARYLGQTSAIVLRHFDWQHFLDVIVFSLQSTPLLIKQQKEENPQRVIIAVLPRPGPQSGAPVPRSEWLVPDEWILWARSQSI